MSGAWWMRQACVVARRLVSALLWAPEAAFWNLDWLRTGQDPHPETHQQRLVSIVAVGEHYGAGSDNHCEPHAWAAGLRAQGLALVALAWALAGEWAACLASAAAPHPVNVVQRSSLQGTRQYDVSCLFARPALQDSPFQIRRSGQTLMAQPFLAQDVLTTAQHRCCLTGTAKVLLECVPFRKEPQPLLLETRKMKSTSTP